MHPNIVITKESIPLDKILVTDDNDVESLEIKTEAVKGLFEQGVVIEGDTYPWECLVGSMYEHWDPGYRSFTYHEEPKGFSPFRVDKRVLDGEVVYVPQNGRHRLVALRALNIDPVDCFVVDSHGLDHVSVESLNSFLTKMNSVVGGGQQYQSLFLPNNVIHNSRDVTMDVFRSSGWDDIYWCGKTVLDVGCHIGQMCFEAKRRGASRVVGFDLDGKLTGLGKELSELLGLEVEFYNCDFWEFPLWGEKFDIVMAHQCMYHFTTQHRCVHAHQHTEDEMLDLITNACVEDLFSYTFIHHDDVPSSDPEGYRPTGSEFTQDLKKRGFVHTKINTPFPWAGKRTMIASKVQEHA